MTNTNLKTFMFEKDNLDNIKAVLENGGLILYPTDTIWGIGCDATNPQAVDKIYDLKQRDRNKGFIILVDSVEMMKDYVAHIHPRIDTLLLHHVRPLTIIFDHAKNLPANLVSPDGSIAVRMVLDDFCKDLISNFGKPLIATSANIGDEPFPGNFGEISSAVIEGVDYVFKQRRYEKDAKSPSIIVKAQDDGEFIFIRE
ncbi:MAG: L-threonylcarbamoyladenylate synthase [Saprospiraceae bacterium]|jgi:L-threonylcarbamoyladenylate synthase